MSFNRICAVDGAFCVIVFVFIFFLGEGGLVWKNFQRFPRSSRKSQRLPQTTREIVVKTSNKLFVDCCLCKSWVNKLLGRELNVRKTESKGGALNGNDGWCTKTRWKWRGRKEKHKHKHTQSAEEQRVQRFLDSKI